MPPRVTKKTAAGPGRRPGRGRGKAQAQLHPEESNVKAEAESDDVAVVEAAAARVEDDNESEPEEILMPEEEDRDVANKKDDSNEPIDEYERDERLDLEDNEPEYEPEEDGGVYYDEKDAEQYPHEEGHEVEEDPEEVYGEEEEGDVPEEGMEGRPEELETEEDNERVEEEHAEMVNAAEEEEHHEIVKERRKRKEFEIFVGGLDKDATENDLRGVFSKVGEVTEVRLMMNPQTKKNKGFAFLRFATVEQAKRACSQLKNPVVHGKQCGVTPSQDSDTLFLGNVCRTWTKEALKEKLKNYGIENIEDLTLVDNSNHAGMNRGFAFVEFSSRSDAMDAFKRLQKRDVQFGVDKPAKVSFADSFIDPGDEIMAQVKTVFLDGLSASWDEEHVNKLLEAYGKIEKVELARNMPSARRKDFGFVTFDTHEAAVTCAKSINNEELGEGDNKAKVRARLSRPLQRGKGKHVSRRDSRPGRGPSRGARSSWSHPAPRRIPPRGSRGNRTYLRPVVDHGYRRPPSIRDRRPVMAVPPRSRPVAPLPRSYDRRPPAPPYPKSGAKREYGHREELHPRSKASAGYGSRVASERRLPYRDDYPPRGYGYPDLPRGGPSRSTTRRAYDDDGYDQRYERQPPTYQEVHGRDYHSMSGSKRSYSATDDAPSRYSEAGVRHSRARLDYDVGSSASHYGDAYSDRFGRSNVGYGGSRSSLSSQDAHVYSGRQGMGYSGGSYGGSDVGGMYSSSYGGDYISRGSDVGGNSYSSAYSGRGLGGDSYMRNGRSGSYY